MSVEHVRNLEDWSGMADLYRRGDGFVVVSTVIVPDVVPGLNALGQFATAFLGQDPIGNVGDEETLVFAADANGNVESFTSLMAEVGDGSRQRVLDRLETQP